MNLKNSLPNTNYNSSFVSNFIKELENFLNMDCPKFYTLERFEGNFAVCENRETLEFISIPKKELPKGIKPRGNYKIYK